MCVLYILTRAHAYGIEITRNRMDFRMYMSSFSIVDELWDGDRFSFVSVSVKDSADFHYSRLQIVHYYYVLYVFMYSKRGE
jgi:hypothetical protein